MKTRWVLGVAACLLALSAPLHAGTGVGGGVYLEFDLTLENFELTGPPVALPLVADPGHTLPDTISGYGWVNSVVTITLSSQRSSNPGPATLGEACAFQKGGPVGTASGGRQTFCDFQPGPPPVIDPAALDGQGFLVDSFFDVFFDITVTDVDNRPGRDIAGQPDGASIQIQDVGPAAMQNFYFVTFNASAPNFGLIPPPEAAPYIGHFTIEIPLGGDINGNGENDKVKFTLVTHSAGDGNRTFIQLPDGTIIDEFDSGAVLEGAVVDESTDPPFQIGQYNDLGLPDPAAFGGRTTATSNLRNPVVPEPTTMTLLALGGLAALRRRAKA